MFFKCNWFKFCHIAFVKKIKNKNYLLLVLLCLPLSPPFFLIASFFPSFPGFSTIPRECYCSSCKSQVYNIVQILRSFHFIFIVVNTFQLSFSCLEKSKRKTLLKGEVWFFSFFLSWITPNEGWRIDQLIYIILTTVNIQC